MAKQASGLISNSLRHLGYDVEKLLKSEDARTFRHAKPARRPSGASRAQAREEYSQALEILHQLDAKIAIPESERPPFWDPRQEPSGPETRKKRTIGEMMRSPDVEPSGLDLYNARSLVRQYELGMVPKRIR